MCSCWNTGRSLFNTHLTHLYSAAQKQYFLNCRWGSSWSPTPDLQWDVLLSEITISDSPPPTIKEDTVGSWNKTKMETVNTWSWIVWTRKSHWSRDELDFNYFPICSWDLLAYWEFQKGKDRDNDHVELNCLPSESNGCLHWFIDSFLSFSHLRVGFF